MAYVDLQLAKRHLNVEQEFTDDDEYISGLIEAAEVVCVEGYFAWSWIHWWRKAGRTFPRSPSVYPSDGGAVLCQPRAGGFRPDIGSAVVLFAPCGALSELCGMRAGLLKYTLVFKEPVETVLRDGFCGKVL